MLTRADLIRHAAIHRRFCGCVDGGIVAAVDLFCISYTIHGGYVRLLEVNGQDYENES